MNESILRALMRLFAIVAHVDERGVSIKALSIVESYLKPKFNHEFVDKYLNLFDEYLNIYHVDVDNDDEDKDRKRHSLNSVKVLKICKQINEGLEQKEKIVVFMRLVEFVNEDNVISYEELDFIETVANTFNIGKSEFANIKSFVLDQTYEITEKDKLLIVNNEETVNLSESDQMGTWFQKNRPASIAEFHHLSCENLEGDIRFLYIQSINTIIFKYLGNDYLYLSAHNIYPGRIYILDHGAIIKSSKIRPIYYTNIIGKFLHEQVKARIVLTAWNIEFHFRNSKNGIHQFSLQQESGRLLGVMGGSGVGKSTLLDLLSGKLNPNKGEIYINGYNIRTDKEKLEGVIGFVPQDDLLIEELTVYQNLYFNAKLCFSGFDKKQIATTVEQILADLDLHDIRDLRVGNPLNKYISGGQRKRLNIALELMREPSVLFVDEPTSGLSSMDSEKVMLLLKQQTLKGKLVIANIHQPSSDVYKLFDHILFIDKGGHIIFQGNPIDAVVYFKTLGHHVNALESECASCGNVNAEQILEIVEDKVVNEFGKLTTSRKTTPVQWYNLYKKNIESKLFENKPPDLGNKEKIPRHFFNIPSPLRQFRIFGIRDILAKLTNRQYLLINFLEAPLLALILAFFSKYISGTSENVHNYNFSENVNIPAYLFMSVVVSLFMGLTVSAEEIIKDRKILKREAFLNLSRISYINSKVLIMFTISAIQTISFVLVGNYILEIQGMVFSFWFILFSTSCWANLVGLNISSGLNSVITIYILIPFILVPQLLLGGVLVNYDKLHESIASNDYVPVVGDLMISRWAFEALTVQQFKENKYNKHFFEYEKQMSNASFQYLFLVPKLESKIDLCLNKLYSDKNGAALTKNLSLLKREMPALIITAKSIPFNRLYLDSLRPAKFTPYVAQYLKAYLAKVKSHCKALNESASANREQAYKNLSAKMGKEKVFLLKQQNYNKRLNDFLLNNSELSKLVEVDGKLLRKYDPIFMSPSHPFGRAHFYAPDKRFFNNYFDTFKFNVTFIWLFSFILYLTLQANLLALMLKYVAEIRLSKQR